MVVAFVGNMQMKLLIVQNKEHVKGSGTNHFLLTIQKKDVFINGSATNTANPCKN